ncbi:MAG: FKBP-type peptidyl-prolyl cis-trans isomerase [Bacteroidaceae bacterium]|nr:FKBP-type peptidyl-prolyl cis-trans isomerase [Bacteroidaceae bacterium]
MAHVLLIGLLATAAIACQEVKEESEYDNWEERNQLFVDSISDLAAGRIVVSASDADAMEVGTYYAIETSKSTNYQLQYIYVKKLTANKLGSRPYYTDGAEVYYYGTDVTGVRFDGNFIGYTSVDKGQLDGEANMPTELDETLTFEINGSIIEGWKTVLQYMREGERWMVYIPYQSAYGKDGSGTILGYSMLCFDIIMERVVKE